MICYIYTKINLDEPHINTINYFFLNNAIKNKTNLESATGKLWFKLNFELKTINKYNTVIFYYLSGRQ